MSAITHQPHPARLGAKNRGAPAGRGTGFETGPDHNYLIKIVGSTILVVLGVAALALLGWAMLPVALLMLLATTWVACSTPPSACWASRATRDA